VDGATVSLVCGNNNPTPYPEWPDPASGDAVLHLAAGAPGRGGLTFAAGSGAPETLSDDAGVTASTLMNAATEDSRLLYQTNVLREPVRISGTPRVSLNASFSKSKANLTAVLVSLPESGNGTILTRGWIDPENRASDAASEPVSPGTFYTLSFAMQPKDTVVAAGRRLALMVFSSDRQYTVRPAPGTQLTLDPAASSLTLPVLGTLPAPETPAAPAPVPLGLTLGPPATFGRFIPGVARQYAASTTAAVSGNGVLTVGGGRLANGAAGLPQPLSVALEPTGTVTFGQAIAATDVLRTGVYSAPVTFTVTAASP